uniref:Putative integrase n=1 Tax=Cladonia uncialis subsp. uncialis TaxID=180999 RepID=A0A1Z1CBQ0_CLAUC|nr:putative integrase [Cladonia uncialis subsp. uncialis]AUW30834.1 putative integrase - catalytic core [Cladonia uncialis subsp. uncialis]
MKVFTADDVNTLDILGGGTVEVSTMTDTNEKVILELSKVVYSPGLRCNILSLSLLGKVGGLQGRWSTDKIDIVMRNSEPVCSATERDGLYVLNFSNCATQKLKTRHSTNETRFSVLGGVKPPCIVATIDFREKVWKWHRRLGHLGWENLRRLLKVSEGMDITDKDIQGKLGAICPICVVTRATFAVPRDPATRRFKSAGDLLHLDAWGLYIVAGIDSMKGFVALTDDATRFVMAKAYKAKKDIVEISLKLLKTIERTHNVEVRRVRMDNEFFTNAIEAYFEERGIIMEPIAPHHHYQNGVAERGFRTERERAAAMIQESILPNRIRQIVLGSAEELLQASTIPEKLWPEAWKHAVWLKNRSPTRALKSRKTPWELFTEHPPNLSKERVWGSRTYVTVPLEVRQQDAKQKLHSPRGWMGYFVGCESESIYRVWNPDKNKVVRISNVRIDDGEGLDDPQEGPNRNDRAQNRTTPERREDVIESDSGESGSDSSKSQRSLVYNIPGAQREDVFMSGAIQSDVNSGNDQNNAANWSPPPAPNSGSDAGSTNTRNEVAQATNGDSNEDIRDSASDTSDNDSSSTEGEGTNGRRQHSEKTSQGATWSTTT